MYLNNTIEIFNILLGKTVDLKELDIIPINLKLLSDPEDGSEEVFSRELKGGFVPEQHTDYIFTTVGEEWGFIELCSNHFICYLIS
jgi:rod shape determining protein RodA